MGNVIKKMEVELEKMITEPAFFQYRHSGKTDKEEPTRYSVNSDDFSLKKHQEELASIMAEQGNMREGLQR